MVDQKLSYPAREGWHRLWVNDVGTRIGDRVDEGYRIVYEPYRTKKGRLVKMPVTRVVGKRDDGKDLRAYLMECPWEVYQAQVGNGRTDPDTAYLSYMPKASPPYVSTYDDFYPHSLERLWSPWRLIHHACEGCPFRGVFNWHLAKGWVRLVVRPKENVTYYFRLRWGKPGWKFFYDKEVRGSYQLTAD